MFIAFSCNRKVWLKFTETTLSLFETFLVNENVFETTVADQEPWRGGGSQDDKRIGVSEIEKPNRRVFNLSYVSTTLFYKKLSGEGEGGSKNSPKPPGSATGLPKKYFNPYFVFTPCYVFCFQLVIFYREFLFFNQRWHTFFKIILPLKNDLFDWVSIVAILCWPSGAVLNQMVYATITPKWRQCNAQWAQIQQFNMIINSCINKTKIILSLRCLNTVEST